MPAIMPSNGPSYLNNIGVSQINLISGFSSTRHSHHQIFVNFLKLKFNVRQAEAENLLITSYETYVGHSHCYEKVGDMDVRLISLHLMGGTI